MVKRNILLLLFVVMLTILAGCEKKDSGEDRKSLVGLEIRVEEQKIPFPEENAYGWYLLGTQFYQGELVQIWYTETIDGTPDIFLFHEDGSREVLLPGAPSDYSTSKWFLDNEGHCILLQRSEETVICLDGRGEELYRRPGKNIQDICQLPDGRIIVIMQENGSRRLGELHCDTGIVDDIGTVDLGNGFGQFIGAGKNGLLLMDPTGLWEINLKNGERECILAFGIYYAPGYGVEDFRMLEDGRLEVLQNSGRSGKRQTLELFDPAAGREIIIVRGSEFSSGMKQCAILFNQTNEEYYVYLEACPEDSDRLNFGTRTLVELGTGKGPDIICAPLLGEEAGGLIENGYVEDLAPWIKKAGIREEDYFPGAFAYLRDGDRIYGISMSVISGTCYISQAVLGDQADPDIEALVDALDSYDGEGVFAYMSAQRILQYFLDGSGDLWGMLDWESGSCRFDGELFAKMLRVARRYADDGKNIRPVLFQWGCNANYYCCEYDRKEHAEKGMVEIGHFFDDGRHGEYTPSAWMAVTSTSPYKEGAWAFLQFMLSDQGQMIRNDDPAWGFYPVNKKSFDEIARQGIEEGIYHIDTENHWGKVLGQHSELYDTLGSAAYKEIFGPTEEKVEQVRRSLEDARMPSLKTAPILDLICEDAEAYFSGTKSIEEVTPIIQNRVQLYMDERR